MMLRALWLVAFALPFCRALYAAHASAKYEPASHHLYARNSTGLTDAVTWDPHSLSIFGQRVFILSAEMHPWRLPGDPALWADVLQKIRANGFNTVSFYTHWATHYPTPDTNGGDGDFTEGTYRDVQLFIDQVKEAGLWLIARPGPYINAETTGGGYPGWVGNIEGDLRTNNPAYTEAWTPYMTAISKIIARNQITEGGPIILVQAENEFDEGPTRSPYMQAVIDTYRDNGIVVPITHNDKHSGQTGNYSPDRPGEGRVNIYCGDSYPQGKNSWANPQSIYRSAHEAVAPSNPLCLAEFAGAFLIQWGEVATRYGTGYEKYSEDLTNADFENIFYKENYAQTATILSIYMLFGGTNWGSLAAPVTYSSYDYGGGINENRVANAKMNEMRLQGLFLRVSRDLLAAFYVANGTSYTTNSAVYTTELRNDDTNAAFYFLRQSDSTSQGTETTQLNVKTSKGAVTIPTEGDITLAGRDSKIIVVDYVFGQSETTVLYSTAEVLTWTTIDSTDYIVLYAGKGQTGQTALLFNEEPDVSTEDGSSVESSFSDGVLTIDYTLDGFEAVSINNGSLVLLLADKGIANTWSAPDIQGEGDWGKFFSVGTNSSVLVGGPYLVRSASIDGDTLALVGDLNGTTPIEVFAPAAVSQVTWNGAPLDLESSSRGSLAGTATAEDQPIELPTFGTWKVSGSLPEIDPDFDDSNWVTADLTATNYTNLPPVSGDKILYSQQYGFYGGNLLFRGHFNASGDETDVTLSVMGGFAFGYTAWLNGVYLGSGQGNSTVAESNSTWSIPDNTLKAGEDNVLVVLQDHMGISETSSNGGKEPRGIRGYGFRGANTTFTRWALQGNLGGAADALDTFRGYLNEGGLYAERIGAHLPGFPDDDWAKGDPVDGVSKAGVNFYRTQFDWDLPDGFDVPIRLVFEPTDVTSKYRAQVYLNGWQVGKYVNNIGPQTWFVLPAGLLRRESPNTLAISVWSLDEGGAKLGGLSLRADGYFASSLTFQDYAAPDYGEQADAREKANYVEAM
ncbi:glycoside hydrolase family 35 protein [Schizophyllum commune H4-8]|uniref:glycoside hydrolase family 35 protein n=1 Tax=Schizophyllum commune (strain H4-8 / FGSC 9210) TaxID=578458 RepID=UPI00216030C2|nr:glycoside hydrolase family 35 protein [Schizophyllum commune H4-8]KAI5890378.1 glycoside hydrolase family 35 protein [Schizophyllum commune H4-8]